MHAVIISILGVCAGLLIAGVVAVGLWDRDMKRRWPDAEWTRDGEWRCPACGTTMQKGGPRCP